MSVILGLKYRVILSTLIEARQQNVHFYLTVVKLAALERVFSFLYFSLLIFLSEFLQTHAWLYPNYSSICSVHSRYGWSWHTTTSYSFYLLLSVVSLTRRSYFHVHTHVRYLIGLSCFFAFDILSEWQFSSFLSQFFSPRDFTWLFLILNISVNVFSIFLTTFLFTWSVHCILSTLL